MIDATTEKLVTFSDVVNLLPPTANGERLKPVTIWRWHRIGLQTQGGVVKLEANKLGRRLLTSMEAIQRFMEKLNATVPE